MSGTGEMVLEACNAYLSVQSGRASRKIHYGRPAEATGRLARREQQDPAASLSRPGPVRGSIRVEHCGSESTVTTGPPRRPAPTEGHTGPRARTPRSDYAGPPSLEPSHCRASHGGTAP